MPYLRLRAATMTDLQDLHELYSDEEVMRYWYAITHVLKLITKPVF